MRKYWAFFKTILQLVFAYRARSVIWFFWDVVPPTIMLLFWQAAFARQEKIAGYSISSMFVYYLLVMFIRAVVFTHPDHALQVDISTGKLSSFYLMRPARVLFLRFIYELAYKILRLIFLFPVIGLFLLFYPVSLGSLNFSWRDISLFFIFISFSFILFFLFKLIIGLSAFWFNEIGWLNNLTDFLLLLFGGTLFPLQFLPESLYKISLFLPFRFEVFVPTQIFLGNLGVREILLTFSIQFFWIVIFLFLTRSLWRRGLKVYSTYGG